MSFSDLSFEGKRALVTGGKMGIGRGIALGLAERGVDVAICSRGGEELDQVANEIRALGRRSLAVRADISRKADVERMIQQIVKEFGGIDILVNNAAIFMGGPTIDFTEQDWQKVLDINLKGALLCSQEAAKVMIPQGGGKIINIGSVTARGDVPQCGAYAASKAGLIALTHIMAIEWAQYNILVNAISPGTVPTAFVEGAVAQDAESYAKRLRRTPIQRRATPQDVANAVMFFVSDDSSYIIGRNLVVDGGLQMMDPGAID